MRLQNYPLPATDCRSERHTKWQVLPKHENPIEVEISANQMKNSTRSSYQQAGEHASEHASEQASKCANKHTNECTSKRLLHATGHKSTADKWHTFGSNRMLHATLLLAFAASSKPTG